MYHGVFCGWFPSIRFLRSPDQARPEELSECWGACVMVVETLRVSFQEEGGRGRSPCTLDYHFAGNSIASVDLSGEVLGGGGGFRLIRTMLRRVVLRLLQDYTVLCALCLHERVFEFYFLSVHRTAALRGCGRTPNVLEDIFVLYLVLRIWIF